MGSSILVTSEVITEIFPNLNVVAHLVIPCRLRFLPAKAGYVLLIFSNKRILSTIIIDLNIFEFISLLKLKNLN